MEGWKTRKRLKTKTEPREAKKEKHNGWRSERKGRKGHRESIMH